MSLYQARTPYARALLFVVAVMAAGTASAQARWTYSADGSEVTDNQTGLRWRRCSEGQMYSAGNCLGNAWLFFTNEAALAHAKNQTGWRMPNIKELSSIVDTDRLNPSIDVAVYPATPGNGHWSSSPYAGIFGYAWGVYFDDGTVWTSIVYGKVRLVR